MKTITYFLIALVLVVFSSCNEKSDTSYYKVETKLDAVIPIFPSNSTVFKSESGQLDKLIPFSGTNDYEMSDLVDPSNHIHRIEPLDGSVLIIPDVNEVFEISSLELNWGYKSETELNYTMMKSIDLTSLNYSLVNGSAQFDLDEITEQIIAEINDPGMILRFSISGECNNRVSGLAKLQIPVIIESEIHDFRFELF